MSITTKPLLQTNVCLILPYVLPVVVDCPVNLTLTTTRILYCQNQNSSASEEFEEPSWVDLSKNVLILRLVHPVMDHLLTQVKYYVCSVCQKSWRVYPEWTVLSYCSSGLAFTLSTCQSLVNYVACNKL